MEDAKIAFRNTENHSTNVRLGTIVGLGAVALFSLGMAKIPFANAGQKVVGFSAAILGGTCVGLLTELFVNGPARCERGR